MPKPKLRRKPTPRHNKQHLPHAASLVIIAQDLKVKAANRRALAARFNQPERAIAFMGIEILRDLADSIGAEAKRVRSLR